MIERILECYRRSRFDFEKSTNPEDPLRAQFPHWKDHFRMKCAVASALRPKSILGIGVRYGYSAIAFLNGAPDARYLGLEPNGDSSQAVEDALQWARRITRGYRAKFLVEDPRAMKRLPGGTHDLVHVVGRADGDGTYHDLSLAVAQARFILLDGYFGSGENLQVGSAFLRDHVERISYALVIPSYGGQLLVKVRERGDEAIRHEEAGPTTRASDLRDLYTEEYFLEGCGGCACFEKSRGRALDDARLRAVFSIAQPVRGERVLDLGCGRGELSYHSAAAGAHVTGVDYSRSAIEITRSCVEGDRKNEARTNFVCADIAEFEFEGQYDKVIAADLVEHLSPDEVEALYERVAEHLSPGGLFVLHTFPNLWFYKYGHAAKRRAASRLGYYLSPQPRSRYERLMHINEQSPRVLKAALNRYFPHVELWFGSAEDPAGSLARPYRLHELRDAPELFAVASRRPLDTRAIVERLLPDRARRGANRRRRTRLQ